MCAYIHIDYSESCTFFDVCLMDHFRNSFTHCAQKSLKDVLDGCSIPSYGY